MQSHPAINARVLMANTAGGSGSYPLFVWIQSVQFLTFAGGCCTA